MRLWINNADLPERAIVRGILAVFDAAEAAALAAAYGPRQRDPDAALVLILTPGDRLPNLDAARMRA